MEWILMNEIIPFAIGLVIGAFIWLIIIRKIFLILEVHMRTKQRNHVHFYVARDKDGILSLYMGKPIRSTSEFLPSDYGRLINTSRHFSKYGLNDGDYAYLKWEDDPVEVFITMNDRIGLFFKIKVCT